MNYSIMKKEHLTHINILVSEFFLFALEKFPENLKNKQPLALQGSAYHDLGRREIRQRIKLMSVNEMK